MAIMHFDPKTARGSVDCGRCLRARFRDMGEVLKCFSFSKVALIHRTTVCGAFLMVSFFLTRTSFWPKSMHGQISFCAHNSSLEGANLCYSAPLKML